MEDGMNGTTLSGFEYTVSAEAMDDMELLEALSDIDNGGKYWQFSKALMIMFGKDQKEAYYSFLREKHGRVPMSVVFEDIEEILTGNGEVKNS